MASSISSLVGNTLDEFLPLLPLILPPDPKPPIINLIISADILSGIADFVKKKIQGDEYHINLLLVTKL